jgi:hypothetical protein
MQLKDIMPAIACELERSLLAIGEEALARSVQGLEIVGRCGCGQRDCGTFFTRPRSDWVGKPLKQVFPELRHLITVDVFQEGIVCVEFLGRSDVIAALNEHMGDSATDQSSLSSSDEG